MTMAHATEFFGHKPVHTMRGYAVVLDGKPVALGGIHYQCGVLCAFLEIKDELRPYKTTIARMALKIRDVFDGKEGMAVASPNEPTADRFLKWIGFEHIGSCADGEVYKWHG